MKKLLSVITAAAVLLGSTIAYASASESIDEPTVETYADNSDVEDQADLLEYKELKDGTLEVSCPDQKRNKLTNVIIPSEVNGKRVTSIGNQAFYRCSRLITVTIPNSITNIGYGAFSKTNLVSILIPDSVTNIDASAFDECSSLISIDIDENNSEYCSADGVVFNKDKTKLIRYPCGNERTFYTIPEGVTSIGSGAFDDCNNLTNVEIPDSVTSIDAGAFYGFNSLTTVTIPKKVKCIDSQAFRECANLVSVTISASVETITDTAFLDCPNLTTINVDENNLSYCSVDGVLFSKDKTTLELYPCGNKKTSYSIPIGVKNIDSNAFYSASLTSVTIPNSVIRIQSGSFAHCTNLESITIPQSVIEIRSFAFYYCTNLESVILQDGVASIEYCAFSNCTSLTSVSIPDSVKNIDCTAFDNTPFFDNQIGVKYAGKVVIGCDDNIDSVIIKPGTATIAECAFLSNSKIKAVTIPDSVTSIAYSAFGDCTSLKSITIPNSVKKIDRYAFSNCKNLTSVKMPINIESIGEAAFSGCENIRSVVIPGEIKYIDVRTFADCSNLKSVTIPTNITSIYYGAFSECEKLSDVYYAGTEEQWSKVSIGNSNTPLKNATIHYNSTGSEIVTTPVDVNILKPAAGAPETANAQVAVLLCGSIIDTIPINDDGTLDLSGVPDGDYTFTFSADNCAPRSYTVSVSSGTVSGLEDGVELNLYGDINGDGIVDIKDVAAANKYFKTGSGLSGYMLSVSDVNGDNIIDIKDVAKMNSHFKQTGNLWQ